MRWWDHWLKGVDTGMLNEPRWTAFMRTGHGADHGKATPGHWRCDARQWPIAGELTQQWYPQAAQQLGSAPLAQASSDALRYRAGVGLAAGNWWGEVTKNMAADDAHSPQFCMTRRLSPKRWTSWAWRRCNCA